MDKKKKLPLDQKFHLRLYIKPFYHFIKNNWRKFIPFLDTEQ
jgi:hypothetical protein